jgi:hypothetical protein
MPEAGAPQTHHRVPLDLPDPLAAEAELPSDLVKAMSPLLVRAMTQRDDETLAVRERAERMHRLAGRLFAGECPCRIHQVANVENLKPRRY